MLNEIYINVVSSKKIERHFLAVLSVEIFLKQCFLFTRHMCRGSSGVYVVWRAAMVEGVESNSVELGPDLQSRVGRNLRILRERQHLTQDNLACLAGLATRHLQKIEAGEVNVTLRTVAKLCVALKVDAVTLFAVLLDKESQ